MSDETLDPQLKARLRGELDRVQPRFSTPRYLSAPSRGVSWRFAPAVLGASVVAILVLSAFFATGSPNPVVWGQRVVTVLEPPKASPSPSGEGSNHGQPGANPSTEPPERESPKPAESPEPNEGGGPGESPEPNEGPGHGESPEPNESPQPPDDDHSGSGSGSDSSGHDGTSESGSSGSGSDDEPDLD